MNSYEDMKKLILQRLRRQMIDKYPDLAHLGDAKDISSIRWALSSNYPKEEIGWLLEMNLDELDDFLLEEMTPKVKKNFFEKKS